MPTVVVILPSTTYRAADFLEAGEGLGVDVVVASDVPPPFDMGSRYLEIDCDQPDEAAKRIVTFNDLSPVDAVVAADDRGVVTAALATRALGIAGNSPASAEATLDKRAQRNALARAEVPQPAFHFLSPGDNDGFHLRFPVVVKPPDRSAGQGVLRADDPQDLRHRLDEVRGIVGSDSPLIVEEYMPGAEIALEGILNNGELTTLAIFDKPEAATGPAFPETILVTPSTLTVGQQEEAKRVASRAIGALGLVQGPVHIEMKVDGDRVRIIEIAARSIGGLCSRSLSFGLLNTSLETLILRNALGSEKPELRRESQASGVLMLPISRSGVFHGLMNRDEILGIEAVTGIEMNMTDGDQVQPPPIGDRYLGFVFARHPDREIVTKSLLGVYRIARVDIR